MFTYLKCGVRSCFDEPERCFFFFLRKRAFNSKIDKWQYYVHKQCCCCRKTKWTEKHLNSSTLDNIIRHTLELEFSFCCRYFTWWWLNWKCTHIFVSLWLKPTKGDIFNMSRGTVLLAAVKINAQCLYTQICNGC